MYVNNTHRMHYSVLIAAVGMRTRHIASRSILNASKLDSHILLACVDYQLTSH
jgi:hypothetical protein